MWRLAWRNLWRNWKRTAITASAISLSLALQFISYGTGDSTYEKLREAAARSAGGNVLIHADGYWESQSARTVLVGADPIVERVTKVPGVRAVIPRVIARGLISSARGNAGIQVTGIDPNREAALGDMAKYLVAGDFLPGKPSKLPPIVLTKGVYEDLELKLGKRVKVTTMGADGKSTALGFRLIGVVDTGAQTEGSNLAWTLMSTLQARLKMEGAVTQLGVLIDDDDKRAEVKADILAALDEADRKRIEALTWSEAIPELLNFVDMDRKFADLFGVLIFIVVAFGIANTFLMAVMERVRELGLLGALGLTPARVAQLVVLESLLLGVMSIAIALGLGYGAHAWIASHGIDFSEFANVDFEVSGVILDDLMIYSVIEPARWIGASVVVLLLVLLSALYPAWKATRMDPAQAMRTYE